MNEYERYGDYSQQARETQSGTGTGKAITFLLIWRSRGAAVHSSQRKRIAQQHQPWMSQHAGRHQSRNPTLARGRFETAGIQSLAK